MRVIAGRAGGQLLEAPPGHGTRPTADRVREALFSALAHDLEGARVLDLFAGSGALGIEALSRGAAHAVFVERDPRAAGVITANLRRTRLQSAATLRRQDARAFCRQPFQQRGASHGQQRGAGQVREPFDIVLLDPPYTESLDGLWRLLAKLGKAGGLRPGARVVVERDRRDASLSRPPPDWLAPDRSRSYGDTVLWLLTAELGDQ